MMSTRFIKYLAVAGLLCVAGIQAQEIRTPLMTYRGTQHYKFPYLEAKRWTLDAWATGYDRSTHKAYLVHGFDAKELGALFFNKQSFRLSEAFPCAGAGINFSKHPCIALTEISPNLEYTERGVHLGANVERRADNDKLRIGLRSSLPVRSFKVENNACCNSNGCLSQVRAFQREKVRDFAPNIVQSYAYRLDFLQSLSDLDVPEELASPLVKLSNTNANSNITIVEQDVAKNKGTTVIRRNNGTPPVGRWGTIRSQLGALPLAGDGSGIGEGQRGEFVDGTSYSGLTGSSTLWVVPTYEDDAITITPEAETIRNAVELAVQSSEDVSVEDFLLENGISLASQRNKGTGDLRTELYVGYEFNDWFYGEARGAVVWPTSKLQKKPGKVLQLAPGNNGHIELQGGAYGGFYIRDWFQVGIDGLYSQVLERDERRAATFVGATVKGFGPMVRARVDWAYFLGHLDLTFLHPKNLELGGNLTYELYVKTEDNVRFREKCGRDLLGNLASFDTNVIKKRTDVVSHKLGGEVFRRFDFMEIYAGATYVFAGRNAPRDCDVYLGFNVNANWDCFFSF